MNKTNNTEDILDAIRDMMGDNITKPQRELPKDVLELTKPVEESKNLDDLNILELNNPINQNIDNIINKDSVEVNDSNISLDDQKIRKLVREQVQLIPSEKIDQIIREELEKVISEKLSSAEINFKQKDKT